jgi:hypothetical protein
MLARLLFVLLCCAGTLACAASATSPLSRASLLVDKGRVEEASQLLADYLE